MENDPETHGHGELIAITGSKNVWVNKKLAICRTDKAYPDDMMHPLPPTDPKGHSPNVWVYESGSADFIGFNLFSDTGSQITGDNGDLIYV